VSELVLFRNRKPRRPATLGEYRDSGGYRALAVVLEKGSRDQLKQLIADSGLRGRGGAGFPTGTKWSSVKEDAPFPRYAAANTDEMEPGTFKDRLLVYSDPHQLIEGLTIGGYAVRAKKGFVFIRPSYEEPAASLDRAVEDAREAGFLGKNILGSDFSFDIKVHRSAGRYICGESSAMLNATMGKRPYPRKGEFFETEKGLFDMPTLVNNAETLSCVPHIVRNGPEWFRGLAATEQGAGTKLYAVSGKVRNPGCFELPIGTRLSEIIEEHAGGMSPGSKFKACLPGGASTAFLPPKFYDVEMDFDPLKKVGQRLGTAAIMVFDQNTCLLGATVNLIEFFARESCGWCTPCREGLPYLLDVLRRIEEGEGREEFIPLLREMCGHMQHTYCALAPGAAEPVTGLLDHFEDEVREHISQRKCPFRRDEGLWDRPA
jgi:NADH-quinone oxidoreductase subunit F